MSSKPLKTRSQMSCPIFGIPSDLTSSVLPTISDIIKYILYVRYDLQEQNSGKQPPITEVYAVVCQQIEKIWALASIPTVSSKRMKDILKKYYDEYLKLIRYPKQKRSDTYKEKVKVFRETSMTRLFDVSACKCMTFDSCKCPKNQKVPIIERPFLLDQRKDRKMMIGGVDKNSTLKLQRVIDRQIKLNEKLEDNDIDTTSTSRKRKILSSETRKRGSEAPIEPIPSTSTAESEKNNEYNTLRLPKLARICDRYGVSNRSAAAIATAVLQDVGLVSSKQKHMVIDKSKVRRARNKARQHLQINVHKSMLESIYFDGRKDRTLLIEKKNGRSYRKLVVREHISIISEPKSQYLGHTTPVIGTGKAICDSLLNFISLNKWKTDDLKCIGCDGTNTNTGWKCGAIRLIELRLKRPLQWFICLLHTNELPLRHLFSVLDGRTSGPQGFTGPIGKALETCELLSVKPFIPVSGNLIPQEEEVIKSLSTDQNYMYEMCRAVSVGVCSEKLANRQPGNLSHSRWLTTANRILRLYVGTLEPSQELQTLVEFIMKVYAPVWFSIKQQPSCEMGPKHIFKLIKYTRYLSDNIRTVLDSVIQRNAFFAHPENILLAMISDNRDFVKELGLRRIIKARKESTNRLRVFKVPKLNFEAEDYIEMIHWTDLQITSPPVLKDFTDSAFLDMLTNKTSIEIEFSKFPCHTQAVERCVKLVTEASLTVAGEQARDGLIRTKIESRSLMPSFDCKAEFKC